MIEIDLGMQVILVIHEEIHTVHLSLSFQRLNFIALLEFWLSNLKFTKCLYIIPFSVVLNYETCHLSAI